MKGDNFIRPKKKWLMMKLRKLSNVGGGGSQIRVGRSKHHKQGGLPKRITDHSIGLEFDTSGLSHLTHVASNVSSE